MEPYDSAPVDNFIEALDIENAQTIASGTLLCHVCNLAGIMSVAIYLDPKDRVYVRVLDLVNPQEREGIDDYDNEESKNLRKTITHFCNRFVDDKTLNSVCSKIRDAYRSVVKDAEASVSFMFPNLPGHRGRTSGKFVAVHMLPYILHHMKLLENPPDEQYEEAWELLREIEELPGQQVVLVGQYSPQAPSKKSRKTVIAAVAVPREDVHVSLAEARKEVSILRETRRREIQVENERRKALEEENKALKTRNDGLVNENARLKHLRATPQVRGALAEEEMVKLFKANALPHCRVSFVGGLSNHADIMITYLDASDTIIGYAIVDVKAYSLRPVDGQLVTKLERDIDSCFEKYGSYPIWAGIISMYTGIAHASSGGLNYMYKTVPILLVRDLLLCQGNDSGAHAVKQMMATGTLFIACKTRRSGESLRRELLIETESKEKCQVPDDVTQISSPTPVLPETQPDVADDEESETSEEDEEHEETAEVEEKLPQIGGQRKVMDTRLFIDISRISDEKYRQILILDSLIRYEQGSTIVRKPLAEKYRKLLGMTHSSANRNIMEFCITVRKRDRFMHDVALRE